MIMLFFSSQRACLPLHGTTSTLGRPKIETRVLSKIPGSKLHNAVNARCQLLNGINLSSGPENGSRFRLQALGGKLCEVPHVFYFLPENSFNFKGEICCCFFRDLRYVPAHPGDCIFTIDYFRKILIDLAGVVFDGRDRFTGIYRYQKGLDLFEELLCSFFLFAILAFVFDGKKDAFGNRFFCP